MIGQFPWDPFPSGEPEPAGPDPFVAALYRAAVVGADAYHAVRQAVRREAGTLRIGNRFVPEGRYREVAFVALGRAASSMALAVLHVFGDRVTQGFVAGPEEAPPSLPFRSEIVPDGWGGAEAAPRVVDAAREIVGGLRASDLFLLLVSPGAVRALLVPPAGRGRGELAELLAEAHARGARGAEVTALARVLGTGGVGGRLLPPVVEADVQTLLVDRGDGPRLVGGGPTVPVTEAERKNVRTMLDRLRLADRLPAWTRAALTARPNERSVPAPARHPVVVAGPSEALRGAADLAFDKGWTSRVGFLTLEGRPEDAADHLLEKTETLLAAEQRAPPSRTKGMAVFAATTLDVPEGVSERPALEAFLGRVGPGLRRREMCVGLARTSGPFGPDDVPGAVIGASTEPDANVPPGSVRRLGMRPGISDVGLLAVAVVPHREA